MHPRLRCLVPFPLVAIYLSLYVFVFFLMIRVAISLSQSNKPDSQKLQMPQILGQIRFGSETKRKKKRKERVNDIPIRSH